MKLSHALLVAALALGACATQPRSPSATAESAWVELFDGHTLDGWTTVGGRYDGHATWTVEDGAITGREGPGRAGGLLYTRELYTDFEFECQVALEWPFDSGVFLRMAPEGRGAQVTLDYRPDGEIAALYSDGYLQHNPTAIEHLARSGWNHLRVRCEGSEMHVQAWLNGANVLDFQLPAGSQGFAPTGRIGIQVHGDSQSPPGTKVQYRALRVRRLGR